MADNSGLVPSNSSSTCFLEFPLFDPYNQDRPDTVHPTWTFLIVVNGLVAPPTTIINALVIWTVMRDENIRSSPYNTVLASLAVTDLLVGLVVQPLFCLWLGCLMTMNCQLSPDCAFTAFAFPALACCTLSMASLAIACVERYLAIEHQTFYLNNITWTRVLRTVIIVWLINLTCLLPSTIFLFKQNDPSKKLPPVLAISLYGVIILYCSSRVQLTAYCQGKSIAKQIALIQRTTDEQEQKLKEFKKVFLTSLLVLSSVVLYFPMIIITVIAKTKGKDITSDFKYIAPMVECTLVFLQSLVNPIIMTFRLSYIRETIKKKLCLVRMAPQRNEDHERDQR